LAHGTASKIAVPFENNFLTCAQVFEVLIGKVLFENAMLVDLH
jgi:hypothetical protein